MDPQIVYGLLSLIQDRASGVLEQEDKETRRFAALTVAGSLLDQLKDPTKTSPEGLSIDLGGLLDRLDVFNVIADGGTAGLRDRLRNAVGSFGKSLLEGEGLQAARAAVETSQISLVDLAANVRGLRGAFKERSGEQYVRDLVRITAEVTGDRRYSLRARYASMLNAISDQEKAARWFKGTASMAESLVTGAVEEACLGIAQFQTNPILAASAATYAGTVARKATQHVFLAELAL